MSSGTTPDASHLLEMPFSVVLASGAATVVLASALAYIVLGRHANKSPSPNNNTKESTETTLTIDPVKYPGGSLAVCYATQTGTSESFARTLEREGASTFGFFVHVVDLEDITVEDLKQHKCVIVLAATYGEGEAPDNAAVFVQALCEKGNTQILFERNDGTTESSINEPDCLKGVDYAVFGLGNQQYDHYNAMGKFFDHALERVGASRILPMGLGNDDDDLENDFETWKDSQLWPTLQKLYVGDKAVVPTTESALPDCPYAIEYHNRPTKTPKLRMDQVHGSSRHYFSAVPCPIRVVRELRSSQDTGSTVHVEVDISNCPDVTYETADNLGVLPVNDTQTVESVAGSLGYDLDQCFSLSAAPNHEWHGAPFPMPLTVRECLAKYCDLTAAPRRSDLKLLSQYATDTVDQTFLSRLASKEGRTEYREKIVDQYTGLVQLLEKCPSIQMPLEHFLGMCPLQQTRFYTISSSSSVHPDMIHLTVSVTEDTREDGTHFKGVCSNYLASSQLSSLVSVYNRPSTFRLPPDPATPIIMIGPGTGIAPMRALLQERGHQRDSLKLPVGKNILYFGCKKESCDFLYRDEFEAWQEKSLLTTWRVAFSRDTAEKVYVQHLLAEDGDSTFRLIHEENAYIYVCGGVKMGQDVADTLNRIVAKGANLSRDQAKEYLEKLSLSGRYVQELWA